MRVQRFDMHCNIWVILSAPLSQSSVNVFDFRAGMQYKLSREWTASTWCSIMVPGAIRSWRPPQVSVSPSLIIAHKLVLQWVILQLPISPNCSFSAIQLCHGNCHLLDWSTIWAYNYPFWGIIFCYDIILRVYSGVVRSILILFHWDKLTCRSTGEESPIGWSLPSAC